MYLWLEIVEYINCRKIEIWSKFSTIRINFVCNQDMKTWRTQWNWYIVFQNCKGLYAWIDKEKEKGYLTLTRKSNFKIDHPRTQHGLQNSVEK